MKTAVSVIVPVYRAEQYLDECVYSLTVQTLKNIEIILVDDGSDDNCPVLCDHYQQVYSNIKVIHQENKGVSKARNAGIAIAEGEYIAFCDSDDTMKAEMLETLYQCAEEQRVDIVICGYETYPNGKSFSPGYTLNKKMTSEELICSSHKIHSGNDLCFSVRFFLRNDLLREKKIVFEEEIGFGEDFLFNLKCIMEANSIYVLSDALYNYRINNNSAMRCPYKVNLEQKIQQQYELKLQLFKKYGLDKNKKFMKDLAFYYIAEWGFAGMLFRNVIAAPVSQNKDENLKRIVRLPCLSDNYKRMGKDIFRYGKRNAVFWIACKYRMDFLIQKMVLNIFQQ